MKKSLLDGIYGCLLAGEIGDALGAPTEGMLYQEIKEKYGTLDTMLGSKTYYTSGRPGCFTDDSYLGNYISYAIIQKGGRITPGDFADVIVGKLNPDRLWTNETIIKLRLKEGISPWEAGFGSIPCGCAAMGIAPIGIINAGDAEQAFQDGMNIASVNSWGENRDFGAAIAAAVASALKPGATLISVINDMICVSTEIVYRAMTLTMDLAYQCRDSEEFMAKFYEKYLDYTWPMPKGAWSKDKYFSGNGREYVPVVFALLHFYPDQLNEAIIAGANFGRDCDSIASLIGQIGGALYGAEDLRQDWVTCVEQENIEFFEELYGNRLNTKDVAQQLFATLKKYSEAQIIKYQALLK